MMAHQLHLDFSGKTAEKKEEKVESPKMDPANRLLTHEPELEGVFGFKEKPLWEQKENQHYWMLYQLEKRRGMTDIDVEGPHNLKLHGMLITFLHDAKKTNLGCHDSRLDAIQGKLRFKDRVTKQEFAFMLTLNDAMHPPFNQDNRLRYPGMSTVATAEYRCQLDRMYLEEEWPQR